MQNRNDMNAAGPELPRALGEFEQTLLTLRPSRPAIDRDRALFDAGAAAGRRKGRAWRLSTCVLAMGLGASVLWRPAPPSKSDSRIASAPASPNNPGFDLPMPLEPPPHQDASYVALRDELLNRGLSALPRARGWGIPRGSEPTVKSLAPSPAPDAPRSLLELLHPGDPS